MKKIIFTLLLFTLSIPIWAYDFEVDGIYYDKTSDKEVAVTQGTYSGAIEIPTSVTYSGIVYSVTSISGDAFSCCTELTSVIIGDAITSIGIHAFGHCVGLTSITIPNSVTTIEDYVFYSCIGLTAITIPDGVTEIGEGAFGRCASLENITIPNNVTSIGTRAFYDCISLTSLNIGSTVYSIGTDAFIGCTELIEINSFNFVPPTGAVFEKKVYRDATLSVPQDCKEAYSQTDGWKEFFNITEMNGDDAVHDILVDTTDNEVTYYNLQGLMVKNPEKGVYIKKQGNKTTKVVL